MADTERAALERAWRATMTKQIGPEAMAIKEQILALGDEYDAAVRRWQEEH